MKLDITPHEKLKICSMLGIKPDKVTLIMLVSATWFHYYSPASDFKATNMCWRCILSTIPSTMQHELASSWHFRRWPRNMAWSSAVNPANRMARLKVVKSFDVQVKLKSFPVWPWKVTLNNGTMGCGSNHLGDQSMSKHFPCEMGDEFDSQPIAFRVNFREFWSLMKPLLQLWIRVLVNTCFDWTVAA